MPSFGSFESSREIYSGPSYTVYSARKSGDPKTEYVVKVFHLLPTGLETEAADDLAPLIGGIEESCAERVAVQKKAAEGSKFITPVLESGHDERGVWYATNYYPRSVNKIITGKVALSRNALHRIVSAMATGAFDFKRLCGRSHGDLLPSNVQISRSENIAEAQVLLSDPLPGNETRAPEYELSDLHAIGRILLQLVLQKEIGDEDYASLILPILPSPEWTVRFGKEHAGRWLELCNRLLDRDLSPDRFSLEQLVQLLETLAPKPPIGKGPILALAGAAALLVVAGVLVAMYFKRGHLLITTDPPGAEIKIEVQGQYRSFGKTPPDKSPLRITLHKGAYKLQAEFPGLTNQLGQVEIEGGKSVPYQLAFPCGQVQIATDPAGATVELNGVGIGATPFSSAFLEPGDRTYVLRLTDHQPVKLFVMVPSDRQAVSIRTNLIRLRADQGLVEFQSDPDNATLREGTASLGEVGFKTLSPGSHKITAQYLDWPPLTLQVKVAAGTNPPVAFLFPHGVARFDLDPPDSQVLLNNKSVGTTVRQKLLPPGEYKVRVTHPGYKTNDQTITITDGKSTTISASLEAMLGFVAFTTDPPGATIFEAGPPEKELRSTLPGQPLKNPFQPGTYSFIARYPGLDDVSSEPIKVSMGTEIPLLLRFKYGTITFDSDPPGADVTIAGKKIKPAPSVYIQKPGPVAYHLEMPYYYPEDGATNLAAGASIPVSLRLRPVVVGAVLRSDPPGARFFAADTPLRGSNDLYSLPWGSYSITAKYPNPPGLPGLDPISESVAVDKGGATVKSFQFSSATLDLTNADPDARLLYQNTPITSFPARLYLKPDFQYDFVVEYGEDFRTNLPVKIAANKSFTPRIILPELHRVYTNSINMVLVRVSNDLYAGKFEVTEDDYRQVIGEAEYRRRVTAGSLTGKPLKPAVDVNWQDAQKFCEILAGSDSEKQSLQRQKLAGWRYALPTDAQWATFADTNATVLEGSLFSRAGFSEPQEIDLSRKSASKLGIYDLFGNAAEWCFGPENKPITMGGSVANLKPQPATALSRLRVLTLPADAISNGSPTIGFRCILSRAPQLTEATRQ